MQNKNSKIIIWVLVIIIAIGVWHFLANKKSVPNEPVVSAQISGNTQDLVSFSVSPGQTVSGIVSATGSVKNAYFFEANIIVNILSANQTLLKAGNGQATTDWMTSDPVSFTTTLDFTGLPAGPAFIEIHNDNASDLPENDKHILIPVVIQ